MQRNLETPQCDQLGIHNRLQPDRRQIKSDPVSHSNPLDRSINEV
jgi:hypothetical protein